MPYYLKLLHLRLGLAFSVKIFDICQPSLKITTGGFRLESGSLNWKEIRIHQFCLYQNVHANQTSISWWGICCLKKSLKFVQEIQTWLLMKVPTVNG